MYRTIQVVLGALFLAFCGLAALSRRFPDVAWLAHFRFENRLTEKQKARMRRSAAVHAGVELILLGLALPMGYVVLTVMFFSSFTATAVVLTLAGSVLCIILGVTAIVRSGR